MRELPKAEGYKEEEIVRADTQAYEGLMVSDDSHPLFGRVLDCIFRLRGTDRQIVLGALLLLGALNLPVGNYIVHVVGIGAIWLWLALGLLTVWKRDASVEKDPRDGSIEPGC